MRISDEMRAELKRLRALKRGTGVDYTKPGPRKPPPTGRKNTPHNEEIDRLCAELGLKRTGFRKTVRRELCWPELPTGMTDEEMDDLPDPPSGLVPWEEIASDMDLRPDAFAVVGRELHCYEVVDACRLDADRKYAYGELWLSFDSWGGTVRLWVCDVFGNRAEQDLCAWYCGVNIPMNRKHRAELDAAKDKKE